MDIRILLIGDDPCYVMPDVQLLRDKGIRVYTIFNYENLSEVVKETKPHLLLYNFSPAHVAGRVQKGILNNIESGTPAIHAIAEDDTYMVVLPANDMHRKSVVLADSLVAAIKTGLGNITYTPKAAIHNIPQAIHLHTVSA